MPSSYSPLKLELLATGEKSNLWGDITNSNFTAAIERAITGMAVINFASNAAITLDYLDQSPPQAQQFRNLVLRLTGTLQSPQNLVVPSIEKLYIVWNETGQTVTVKTASGTGAAVAAGAKTAVFIDGVNATMAFSATVDLATGTTGTLPVSKGGTGATTLTGFLKGNGTSAVTAQSTVNISTDTTGTLPVSRGGTGATTLTGVVKSSGTSAFTAGSVNLATEITGVLGTANGGTGLNSLSSFVQTFLSSPSPDSLANIVFSTGTGSYVRASEPSFSGNVTFSSGAVTFSFGTEVRVNGGPLTITNSLQGGNNINATLGNLIFMNGVPAGAMTFTLTNRAQQFQVYLSPQASSTALTWPSNVRWLSAPPSGLVNTTTHVFSFTTNTFDNRIVGRYEGPINF